jgi:hypothetical protein
VVHTGLHFFDETLRGCSNSSLPPLLLHMHAQAIIPTFLTSNIHIGLCFPKVLPLTQLHQQNVNRSGRHTLTSQALRSTSPVLLSTSRCSQASLELSKVLVNSVRVCSGAAHSTYSDGGGFRMPQELTCRIVKFWNS